MFRLHSAKSNGPRKIKSKMRVAKEDMVRGDVDKPFGAKKASKIKATELLARLEYVRNGKPITIRSAKDLYNWGIVAGMELQESRFYEVIGAYKINGTIQPETDHRGRPYIMDPEKEQAVAGSIVTRVSFSRKSNFAAL